MKAFVIFSIILGLTSIPVQVWDLYHPKTPEPENPLAQKWMIAVCCGILGWAIYALKHG